MAQETAQRVKAAGAYANTDSVLGLELPLARLRTQHPGSDILNDRHRLRRKADLEPDAPVDLLAAGERPRGGGAG